MIIDWNDQGCLVTEHFTVRDCLYLPRWNRLADEDDGVTDDLCDALILTCQVVAEPVRKILGVPLHVNSFYRSNLYSPLVGGFAGDVHTMGLAFDFIPIGMSIEDAKNILRPNLSKMAIRIEGGTKTWIHADRHAVGPSGREFTP